MRTIRQIRPNNDVEILFLSDMQTTRWCTHCYSLAFIVVSIRVYALFAHAVLAAEHVPKHICSPREFSERLLRPTDESMTNIILCMLWHEEEERRRMWKHTCPLKAYQTYFHFDEMRQRQFDGANETIRCARVCLPFLLLPNSNVIFLFISLLRRKDENKANEQINTNDAERWVFGLNKVRMFATIS